MHGAEGVGHVQLRHSGQLLGKAGIVLLLAGIEAQVLQQQDLAAFQSGGLGLGVLAHDILGEDDLAAQQLTETLRHRGKAQLFLPLALGLAQMGTGDHRRALVQQVPDGGQRRHDALVTGDLAGGLVLGYVEIAAQQDLLARYIHVHDGFLVVVHIRVSFTEWYCCVPLPFHLCRTGRGSRSAAGPHRSGWPQSC